MKQVAVLTTLAIVVSSFGICGCKSAKPSMALGDDSRVQRLGMQSAPDAKASDGEAVPAAAEEHASSTPVVQHSDATKETRWSRWWDRLRPPKRIPLPLSETESADDAPVELGAATDFNAF